MTRDPWQHRSTGMTCATCMFFVAKSHAVEPHPNAGQTVGRCRMHAPTMRGFPVVFESDWCGDHRLTNASPELLCAPRPGDVIEHRR